MDANIKNMFFNLLFLCVFSFGCSNKNSDASNQITIIIKVIDTETSQPRVNDRVDVREIRKPIFSMWKFIKVGEYFTNNEGEISVRINKDKGYRFSVFGVNHAFGSDEFAEGDLKDGQQIIIKVVPPEKKDIPWIK